MPTYARLTQDKLAVEKTDIALTPEQFGSMGAWKQSFLRPYLVDQPPNPSAAQVVDFAGYVIEDAQVRQTWNLRNKTQAELDADSQTSELTALKTMLGSLTADIQTGVTTAPTTAAQAFVDIQDIKRQVLRLNRAVRWMLKQQG